LQSAGSAAGVGVHVGRLGPFCSLFRSGLCVLRGGFWLEDCGLGGPCVLLSPAHSFGTPFPSFLDFRWFGVFGHEVRYGGAESHRLYGGSSYPDGCMLVSVPGLLWLQTPYVWDLPLLLAPFGC
jgi:hypothetical protein